MSTVLRDAIWGDIDLGAAELVLIDTPAFQRLRRVRQLGFTDLVFPGARHTRFEHSIGVFHLAGTVLRRLAGVSDPDGRALLAAALLHDVGHYPFSHAVEELELAQIRPHTEIARELIVSGELGRALREVWNLEPELVAALVAGPRPGFALTDSQQLLRAVVDSGTDVDKLDYLVRDARAANVPYGLVDVQRLIGSLTVHEGRLAVESKGIAALQSLVFAKHLMFATVYWHHACRSAVAMLLRALQEALGAGAVDARSVEHADDASLVAMLRSHGMPGVTLALATRLRDRRLYKRSVEIRVDDSRFAELEALWWDPSSRREREDAWAASAGAGPADVLLDIPEPRKIVLDLPVLVDGHRTRDWDTVSGLGRADLDRFQTWVRKIRVFAADASIAERVAKLV